MQSQTQPGLVRDQQSLPLPEVPFSGLFSPGFGTALPTQGSWLWRGSFGRLESPWTENRERLGCSLPWLGLLLVLRCSEHPRLCQGVELLFWGQAPPTENKSSHSPAGRQLDVLTLSHPSFSGTVRLPQVKYNFSTLWTNQCSLFVTF